MKSMLKIISVLAVCMSMLLLPACSAMKKSEPLRVGMMSDINSIPYIVAKQQGFYDQNIEITVFMSPTDRDSALFSGNLDGCSTDVLAVCLAQNGDMPMFITSTTSGDYGVIAGKASGVKAASDLKGKEIGLSINTIIEYVTDCILADNKVDPSGITKTAVPKTPSRLELLEAGQISAIAVPEPFVTAAEKSGGVVIGRASDLGIAPCVMAFTGKAVEDKQSLIKAFDKAYDKAVDYMQKTPAEAYMPAVIEELGLPAITSEINLPEYLHTALPEKGQVERAANWLFEKELVDQQFTYEGLVWIH